MNEIFGASFHEMKVVVESRVGCQLIKFNQAQYTGPIMPIAGVSDPLLPVAMIDDRWSSIHQ
jgi:hypothetical protein